MDSRDNLVDELGGFSSTRSLRLQAETTRLFGWHLGGSAERARVDYLSVAGDIKSDTTNYAAQIQQRRVSLSGGHQILTGAGALFPTTVSSEQWLSTELPLSELVATPLLNRIERLDTATAALRVRKQFDVSADFMLEKDLLSSLASEIPHAGCQRPLPFGQNHYICRLRVLPDRERSRPRPDRQSREPLLLASDERLQDILRVRIVTH